MALRPDMDTYAWNRLYVSLCIAVLPSIGRAVLEVETVREGISSVFTVLAVAAGVVMAFMKEPKR